MTQLPLSRISAAAILFGAFAASAPVGAASEGAIRPPASAITQGPLGGIETDGSLDLAFDAGQFTNGEVDGAALQPDGKLLVAGQFNKIHGAVRHSLARLNIDGTLDSSFDAGSVAQQSGAKTPIVQTDGKIIMIPFYFGRIARLNSDGSLDPSFRISQVLSLDGLDDGSGVATSPGYETSAVLQPDGKIVVAGQFFFVITGPGTNVARSCVARFNSDGTFDPTFDPGTGASSIDGNTSVNYAVRQSIGTNSGKIILEGDIDSFDGHFISGLVRLNADGSFDSTFIASGSTYYFQVFGLLVQSDDQVVIFGNFTAVDGVNCSGIARLGSSGGLDTGFSTALFRNYGDDAKISAVAQQPDGRLIVGGSFHSLGGVVANNVVRLETTGAMDNDFDANAAGPLAAYVNAIVVGPGDGKIFVGGYFSTYGGAVRNNLAWVNGDGSLDGAFAGLPGAVDFFPEIYALATQTDGKIVVGGFFSSLNGASHYNIVRLNPDSTIDSSFDPNLGTYGSVRTIFIQPDGKILIGGNILAVNGVARGRVARLNSDGTFDPSFDPGTGAGSSVYAVMEDSAGGIFVGGAFYSFNGVSQRGVIKLDPTGAVDTTFQTGGGTNGTIYAIASPDGAGGIVIGGGFSIYNGFSSRRIARLNLTTGALDTSFTTVGGGFNGGDVRTLALTPDGKYYVGGLFNSFNGHQISRVAKLNGDGSIDGTFVAPPISQIVYQVAPQNGKVFVGGYLLSPPQNIARLTSSGPFDPTFDPGTGIGISPPDAYAGGPAEVSALAIQGDGKLLVGGMFNKYNGITRSCLARLTTAPTGPSGTFGNISTRLLVETGDNVLIGGFIITGTQPKKVIVRAIGPSLSSFFTGALADPVLELHNSSGEVIASNDNWRTDQEAEIIATGIAPSDNLEAAIVAILPANGSAYTAIVRGVNDGTGIGVVEVYDLDPTVDSKLANISTRGFVQTGNDVLIGGLIVLGQNPVTMIVRAIGPSLSTPGELPDPTLELHNGNGALMASNDNWRSDQEAEIVASGIPPANDMESAIVRSLIPGNYTAIVRGVNGTTGIAVVEAYGLN